MIRLTFLSASVLLALAACNSGAPSDKASGAAKQPRVQTVLTTLTHTETVPIVLEAQGNLIPIDEVELRPQKNGMISEIHFKEGDDVKKGQLLFSLDSREDDANVKKAEAAVVSAQALLLSAQRDYERSKELASKNFISPTALDTAKSKADSLDAQLGQARAALDSAKVSRSYTRISAPFDGRAGRVDIRPGSLVLPNTTSTALVKITRLDPIIANFSLPERDLSALRKAMLAGPVEVEVMINEAQTVRGHVTFIENSVDRVSGTIGVKAELDNKQRLLWPGQFVPVRVLAGVVKQAIVIPSQAVQTGPQGRFVYVVKADSTVAQQPIDLVQVLQSKAVITGVDSNVKVVLEGGQNLRPGSKIAEASATADGRNSSRHRNASRAGKASPPAASTQDQSNNTTATGHSKKSDAAPSGVILPAGFTPRDPDRWAGMSDEEKQRTIERWRERQSAKAAGGQ